MRNVIAVVVIIGLGVVGYFYTSSSGKAVGYNDKLIDLQSRIVGKMIEFSNSFKAEDTALIDKKHAELLKTIEVVLKEARAVEPFDGDAKLRDVIIETYIPHLLRQGFDIF